MSNPIYIALSRQMALQRQMEVVANNLANMNTTGFKAQESIFNAFVETPRFRERLAFVQDISTFTNFEPGGIEVTGAPLDLAIKGKGFFVIDTPDGPRYTRDGAFTLDANRQVVTSAGDPVLDENDQPITIPEGQDGDHVAIKISGDGAIQIGGGATAAGAVGGAAAGGGGAAAAGGATRIRVVEFDDPQQLHPVGNGLFSTEAKPQPAETSTVTQGALERSNVVGVLEMTKMIDTARAYQSTSTLLTGEHERLQEMVRRLGRPAA